MNKLFVSAAGSGKTSTLVRLACLEKDKKILFTTFTVENKLEIEKKFVELNNGYIPENVTIQNWFSFLLQHGIKPYQGCILPDVKIRGIELVNEQSAIKFRKGNKVFYWGENDPYKYYLSDSSKVYSDKISKLTYRENEINDGYVIRRLQNIFQVVFIDEIQDFMGYDLEVIELICKAGIELYMAGDPRQITYHTHWEQKNKKYAFGNIQDFIIDRKLPIYIDNKTLNGSFRNNEIICNFANKLYPRMEHAFSMHSVQTGHDGVYIINENEAEYYIQKYRPVQLRNNRKTKMILSDARVLNFGESKGLSFDRILIYPTEEIIKWLNDSAYELKAISKSKLYVAITRARYSVAFLNVKNQINKSLIPFWSNS